MFDNGGPPKGYETSMFDNGGPPEGYETLMFDNGEPPKPLKNLPLSIFYLQNMECSLKRSIFMEIL